MNSILGKDDMVLGPGNLYIKPFTIDGNPTDWKDESDWIEMGLTESTIFRILTTKADLLASQKGTRPANKVITAQQTQIEAGLGEATLERLEQVQQGLSITRDTAGEMTSWKIVNVLGQRDSDKYFWVKFVELDGGVESVLPFDTLYAKAAPSIESAELTFDAATQRFYTVMFETYLNDTGPGAVKDDKNRFAYVWSADVV